MGTLSQWLGRLTSAESVVRKTLTDVGISEAETEEVMTSLFAGFNTVDLANAARIAATSYFARNGRLFTLADKITQFIVEEALDLEVNYGIRLEEIEHRKDRFGYWDERHISELPKIDKLHPAIRTVRVVIGHLNGPWCEDELTDRLSSHEGSPLPLIGSGAWVMEAFLALRPKASGSGSIMFPDSKTSRWQMVDGSGRINFPQLWRKSPTQWIHSYMNVEHRLPANQRLCLVVKPHHN